MGMAPSREKPPGARRTAARIGLVGALVSLLAGLPVGECPAATIVEPHARLEQASSTSIVRLELLDGRKISGRYQELVGDWSDTVAVETRYESWRAAHPEGVPRLGERLALALVSGDTLRGEFRGVGPTFLAIGSRDPCFHDRVEFDSITAAGPETRTPLLWWADFQCRLEDAPILAGIVLQRKGEVAFVPRESILDFNVRGPRSWRPSLAKLGSVAGTILEVAVVCGQIIDGLGATADVLSCQRPAAARSADARFGASDVTTGLRPWAPGETRRP